MIGFEQVLLQIATIANGTATEVAGDAFINSINSLIGTFTALIIAVSGIVIAIISKRSDGRTKTKQEENTVAAAEAVQLVMQKLAESRAEIRQIGQATLSLATTDEQRKQLDSQVVPVLQTTTDGINKIYEQLPIIQALLGIKTSDINANQTIPRESEETLKTLNALVAKARIGGADIPTTTGS